MKLLWQHHKFLVLGFGLAVLVTGFLALRVIGMSFYFSQHRDAELAGWMTIGYIAHSYDIPREPLIAAIGLNEIGPQRLTLRKISNMHGVPQDELERALLDAIATARAAE